MNNPMEQPLKTMRKRYLELPKVRVSRKEYQQLEEVAKDMELPLDQWIYRRLMFEVRAHLWYKRGEKPTSVLSDRQTKTL